MVRQTSHEDRYRTSMQALVEVSRALQANPPAQEALRIIT
jgi:hypothetical protein